jgi:glycosyltransferase involved in cell wall biosynthesis
LDKGVTSGSKTVAAQNAKGANAAGAQPLVSVITATRNVAPVIAALHESLSRQTYPNFEWVVADGVSSDGTLDLLNGFGARSPWVRYISEPDFGVYHALNKAIAAARGQYYVVAGADDLLDADALARYAEVAAGGADVVLARVRRNGKVIGGFYPNRAWIGTARVFAGSHSVGMLIRTDLHQRFGFYARRFPLLADVFFLKTLLRSGSVRFVTADFVAGTFAEGGLTTVNKLQILAENWQIQMLTEPHPLMQTLLFFGKVMTRYTAVESELRRAAQHGFPVRKRN